MRIRKTSGRYQTALLRETLAFIDSEFAPFPHLWPLRDQYAAQVQLGVYDGQFISPRRNTFWSVIRWLGEHWLRPTSATIDVLTRNEKIWNSLRTEAKASGLWSPLLEGPPCRHKAGQATVIAASRCLSCAALSEIRMLFTNRPDLALLQTHLIHQTNAGVFTFRTFQRNCGFGRLVRALVTNPGPPDHAWIDAQPCNAAQTEIFRKELIASGILAPVARRRGGQDVNLGRFYSRAACEHSRKPCGTCQVQRRIVAAFQDFPSLWPLRDRYLAQVHCGFYKANYFHPTNNPLWPLIRALGEAPSLTHAWFDEIRPETHYCRLVRAELVACGLLPALPEHPGVGRFRANAAKMISEMAWNNDEDRRLVERFLRLQLMSRLRTGLKGKGKRDTVPMRQAQCYLRHVLRFVLLVERNGRTCQTFTKTDIEAAWGGRTHGLRYFLQWLKDERVGTERFIPQVSYKEDGYAGVGTPALRASIKVLIGLDVDPSVRLAGVLSYYGVLGRDLALLRASHVLPDGDIRIQGHVCHLEQLAAQLAIHVQQTLLAQVLGKRPVGWDPWLFASADALEDPTFQEISLKLRTIGIKIRRMRTDGQRLASEHPFEAYALGMDLKRNRKTTMRHLKVFASEAGSYAVLLAKQKHEAI